MTLHVSLCLLVFLRRRTNKASFAALISNLKPISCQLIALLLAYALLLQLVPHIVIAAPKPTAGIPSAKNLVADSAPK